MGLLAGFGNLQALLWARTGFGTYNGKVPSPMPAQGYPQPHWLVLGNPHALMFYAQATSERAQQKLAWGLSRSKFLI